MTLTMITKEMTCLDSDNRLIKLKEQRENKEKAIKGIRVFGYNVLYLLHLQEDEYYIDPNTGKKSSIIIPIDKIETDKFRQTLGEVVGIGSEAYKSQRLGGIPWVKIGDMVYIDRYKARQFTYHGLPFIIMPDEQALCAIDEPEKFNTF